MSDIVISVRNVSKHYSVFNTLRSRVLTMFGKTADKGVRTVKALNDVSFEVRRGEAVAIIGRNGSGKSTLLQILTGTLEPTSGHVEVNGRVSALLELGSGFNPEYSGRDNVLLNGLLLGFSREFVMGRMAEIEAFAEIGEAIDQPTKTYSSGMVVRLAFAVQVLLEPEILIVDEALSVGDFFFQQKCLSYIKQLREKGVTLLFVSHDMSTVRDLCDLGLVLRNGMKVFWGDNLAAVRTFLTSRDEVLQKAASQESPSQPADNPPQLTSPFWTPTTPMVSNIIGIEITSVEREPVSSVVMGQEIVFRILYRDVPEKYEVSLAFKNRYDQMVSSFGTINHAHPRSELRVAEFRDVSFRVRMMLEAGEYSFRLALGHQTGASSLNIVHETPWLGPLQVSWVYETNTPPFFGLFGLPATIQIN